MLMRHMILSLVFSLVVSPWVALLGTPPVAWAADSSPSGEALLQKADKIRNPGDSFKMRLEVKAEDKSTEFEVFLKGTDKTLIVTKSPAVDRGRNMLMLDRDFYAFIPNLKRSMRLSLAQKMTGQVANGDIARTRWSGDYDAQIEASPDNKGNNNNKDKDNNNGKNSKTAAATSIAKAATRSETQLLLDANKQNLTYQKIRLWLETASARPLRAEFLSVDGKTTLKRAYFEDYRVIAGQMRPGRMRIEDTGGKQSTITIKDMESSEIPDSTFTTTNLEKAR